jgi:hypothetical protein
MAQHRRPSSGAARSRAVIGGAGLALAVPAAAFWAAPGVAQAAPVDPLCALVAGCASGGGLGSSVSTLLVLPSVPTPSTLPGVLADPFG